MMKERVMVRLGMMNLESSRRLMKEKCLKVNLLKELLGTWRREIREKKLIEKVDGNTATLPVVYLSYLKSNLLHSYSFVYILYIEYISLVQTSKQWLERDFKRTKTAYSKFLLRQQADFLGESSLLFEGERIQEMLTEQLALYSEWIVNVSEARQWFEEGKLTFFGIKSSAFWSK
jgi:hypothetical protein